jgi:hypothetical protein
LSLPTFVFVAHAIKFAVVILSSSMYLSAWLVEKRKRVGKIGEQEF